MYWYPITAIYRWTVWITTSIIKSDWENYTDTDIKEEFKAKRRHWELSSQKIKSVKIINLKYLHTLIDSLKRQRLVAPNILYKK